MSNKERGGLSKREYEAQQQGGTLNYQTGEITKPTNLYSGDNLYKSVAQPVARPNYNNIDTLNSRLMKAVESLNEYDQRAERTQAKIEGQSGVGLIPMGRNAAEAARIASIGRTGYANQVSSLSGAVDAARQAYNDFLSQYNTDREFGLKERQLNQAQQDENKENLYQIATRLKNEGKSWGEIANALSQDNRFDLTPGSADSMALDAIMTGKPIENRTAAEIKADLDAQTAEENRKRVAEASVPMLQDKLNKLNEVTGRGVGAGVTGFIERNWPSMFGAKPDNINIIKSIIGKETLDALLALKAQGGTLGAVSEKELDILQSSASIIGAAAITDKKGNVVGYKMTEGQFKDEIDRMKQSTQRLLDEAKRTAGTAGTADQDNDPLGLGL